MPSEPVNPFPGVDDSAAEQQLDKLLSGGGGIESTLTGAAAAGVPFETVMEVCGIPLRPMKMSDFLLFLRMDNRLAAGKTAGSGAADNLVAIMQVLYVGTRSSSREALAEWNKGRESFDAAVEDYATGLPWQDTLDLLAGAVAYLSDASSTRVSARAPEVKGLNKGSGGVEGNG